MIANLIISFFMLMIGCAMMILWIMEMFNNPEVDMSAGFFRAREKQSNNIFWFHIVAELITAVLLVASGIILVMRDENLYPVAYFALGALFYSSLNSMGWAFAYRERYNYAYPIIGGFMLSVIAIIVLIA